MEEHVRPSSPLETAQPLSNDALRELQERAAAALSASREQAVRLESDITRQLDEIAASLSDQLLAGEQTASATQQHEAEISRLANELTTSRNAWRQERESLQNDRDELVKQAEELEGRHRAAHDEWRSQLLDFEARLGEQQNSWNEQRSDWTTARSALESERDELQHKFKLALEDVQRLRERVAELEHDLARRPEAAQADSAELVALRAERDALLEQVEQLEHRPATQVDPDVDQQIADLQRRFELAVEDVRELKTKNAKLESQLAAAGSSRSAAAAPDAGGMDWESQKRRLLAALDGGEDSADAPTQQERATIEGTIEMTDAVVAEKDRRIAELTAELEAARDNPASEDARNEKLNELLDADEVIAEHRRRTQQLEQDMEGKLRAAELEISVERAKIARQRVELEELRTNLEAQRQLYESTGGIPVPGAPRRRWLSKLGIDGKEKD
jgi:chromosome segregation ATPase